MKKFLVFLTLIAGLLSLAACSKPATANKHHELITQATAHLKAHWKLTYTDAQLLDHDTDGYFEIKNTRVITIKENEIDLFQDVAYIVEYVLYSDYMGCAPYYEECGISNTVVIYKDGTMNVNNNLIRMYRNMTAETDFSDFIEAIDDYKDQYNCVETLK